MACRLFGWTTDCLNVIWTSAGLLSIEPLGTHFSEILIKLQQFSYKKTSLKMSSAKIWLSYLIGSLAGFVVSFQLSVKVFIIISSSNDVVPDGTKPLHEPMMTDAVLIIPESKCCVFALPGFSIRTLDLFWMDVLSRHKLIYPSFFNAVFIWVCIFNTVSAHALTEY